MKILVNQKRVHRHARVRSRLSGTATCPRLAVWRSLKHISVQAIDDNKSRTLVSASDKELTLNKGLKPVEIAGKVGKLIAEKLIKSGVTTVVFDRGGFAYHGRVKALAEAARAAGLKF